MLSGSRRAVGASLFAFLVAALVGCGGSNDSPTDAATDTFDEAFAPPDSNEPDVSSLDDTGPQRHCLLDDGSDPVAFCTQKSVFLEWHDAAFIKSLGIAQSWDSTSFLPDKDSTGAVLHDKRDDVLFAAASARYLTSGSRYGDNEIESQVLTDLLAIDTIIEAEYATPDGSDPELYRELRDVAATLRQYFDTTNAQKIDAIADAMGSAIYSNYHELGAVPPPPPSDAGDASTDASTDATIDAGGGGSDATSADVASDVPDVPLVDGILGTPASGGGFEYGAWQAAYGAAALLDMAARHPTDANATHWQRAAIATFDHIARRARDGATGLVYTDLVTSSDPGHDTLAGAAPTDTLQTDVQAGVALALSHAQEIVETTPSAFGPTVSAYPYVVTASSILDATDGVTLWDADKGGYFDGWSPSTSTATQLKSTRGNALMLGAVYRVAKRYGTKAASHLMIGATLSLRATLIQETPSNTSLLSAVADQQSWFTATSPAFDLSGLTDALAKSYFTSANAIACEGLWEQWFDNPDSK